MQSIGITLFYVAIGLIGILLITLGAIWKKREKQKMFISTSNYIKKEKVNKDKFFDLDKYLDSVWFVVDMEKDMYPIVQTSAYKITPRTITKARLLMILLSILFCILLKNIFILLPISIMLYQIPFALVKRKATKREIIFGEQLLDNFQMFVTDFTSTKNVQETVYNMSKKTMEPLKTEWTLLNANLSSGVSPEHSFVTFADRTGNKWARIFAQIMISYYNTGTSFTEQLMSLTEKMTNEKIVLQENRTEISSMVTLNIVLNACVPVVYIFNKLVQPETAAVFTDTTSGRFIILGVTLACMLSLYLAKKIAEW